VLWLFPFGFAILAVAAENKNEFSSISIQLLFKLKMVNSQWLNSPAFKIISNFSQLPKTFFSSTNLLENNMQLPKMQNALWQKKGSSLLFKTRANQLSKSIMHIQEKNEVAPKRPNSLANAKQQVYFENKG
jgi:hypothetical protein